MTSSPSEEATGRGFDLLARPVQRWINQQGWTDLQDVQTRAVGPIMAGDRDVLVTASTAGGKTEAAFLPILSALVERREESGVPQDGVEVLAVSPLKALINDQFGRLEGMCRDLDVAVHAWHGDVPAMRKKRVWRDRSGILFITPESLEGLLCHRGEAVGGLLGRPRYVVIDELHAFPGSARGAQLSSVLHRVDLLARRRVARVGLSATIGDLAIGAEFLRPGRGDGVVTIEGVSGARARRTVLRGHQRSREGGEVTAVADHLYSTLRGQTNLVFANRRTEVETYADHLRRRCERARVPNEFFAHHGSLAKAEREDVEERLRGHEPATAVCTSTLEMGIDIGQVREVAQVRCPPSVAALRQRWGRSGRKADEPSILRTYITEAELNPDTEPQDAVRAELVQTIAMLELIRVHDWCEEPESRGLHLSTLVQQVLSLTAQHGGVREHQAESVLCSHGPFRVDTATFARVIESMHTADLLMSSSDGLLLPGGRGEREIEHWSFLAAFASPEVVRVLAHGQEIGTVDAANTLVPGAGIVLAGRRWRVIAVHASSSEIEVIADSAGLAPRFPTTGTARVHDRVRSTMRGLYLSTENPAYLDEGARTLLAEGRATFDRLDLARRDIIPCGHLTMIFPWRGDRVMDTLRVALHHAGVESDREGPAIVARSTEDVVHRVLQRLAASPAPDPLDLARTVPVKAEEKWDEVLAPDLLDKAYAARALDVEGAWSWLRGRAGPDATGPVAVGVPAPRSTPPIVAEASGPLAALGTTPFAVVDVETTGLSPGRGHRIVEIAVVSCRADGTVEDIWHTLLDPERDVGPSWIHGLDETDVLGAPSFAEVAGDVAARLQGRIVVAHNAPFDMGFLSAEYSRIGHATPTGPTLCTMAMLDRLDGPPLEGRSLVQACRAHGIPLTDAHSAREDALATAALLRSQLGAAGALGLEDLCAATTRLWVKPEPAFRESGRTHLRRRAAERAPGEPVRGSTAGSTAYEEAVRWALADGEITSAEIDHLVALIRTWTLDLGTVSAVHERAADEEQRRDLAVIERLCRFAVAVD